MKLYHASPFCLSKTLLESEKGEGSILQEISGHFSQRTSGSRISWCALEYSPGNCTKSSESYRRWKPLCADSHSEMDYTEFTDMESQISNKLLDP